MCSSCGYLCEAAAPEHRAVKSTFDLLGCASHLQCRKPRALHRNIGQKAARRVAAWIAVAPQLFGSLSGPGMVRGRTRSTS